MWFQLKFSLFGREIFALELGNVQGQEITEEDWDELFEEESCDDDEEEDESWVSSLRWGEHPQFERIVFSPLV